MSDIILTDEECKSIVTSLALSDHLGDARDAIRPLTKKMGLRSSDIEFENLKKKDLLPKHLKEDLTI